MSDPIDLTYIVYQTIVTISLNIYEFKCFLETIFSYTKKKPQNNSFNNNQYLLK